MIYMDAVGTTMKGRILTRFNQPRKEIGSLVSGENWVQSIVEYTDLSNKL